MCLVLERIGPRPFFTHQRFKHQVPFVSPPTCCDRGIAGSLTAEAFQCPFPLGSVEVCGGRSLFFDDALFFGVALRAYHRETQKKGLKSCFFLCPNRRFFTKTFPVPGLAFHSPSGTSNFPGCFQSPFPGLLLRCVNRKKDPSRSFCPPPLPTTVHIFEFPTNPVFFFL